MHLLAWHGLNRIADLLEPRVAQPHPTVIVPLHKRVVFVCLLHCSEFSSRLSKMSQTLDAISGFSSSPVTDGSASGGLLARSASAAAPACDRGGSGALRSLDVRLLIRLRFHSPVAACFVQLLVN
jgi:hypothetical protein